MWPDTANSEVTIIKVHAVASSNSVRYNLGWKTTIARSNLFTKFLFVSNFDVADYRSLTRECSENLSCDCSHLQDFILGGLVVTVNPSVLEMPLQFSGREHHLYALKNKMYIFSVNPAQYTQI